MSKSDISIIVEDVVWKKSGVTLSRIRAAARLAFAQGNASPLLPHAKRGGGGLQSGGEGTRSTEMPPPPGRGTSPTLHAGEESCASLSLLLTNDDRLRLLNAQFRGKDLATNVLSFPAAGSDGYLGDIAIAFGVTSREAAAAGISLEAHTLHLAVHGVLHLLGYDHIRNSEARIMECLEIATLDKLGIPSPYARATATR